MFRTMSNLWVPFHHCDALHSIHGSWFIQLTSTPTRSVLTMLRSTKEPRDTTTQARRSSLWWRSVITSSLCDGVMICHWLNRLCLAGDSNDKRTAGADGTYGECVQSRHPPHHLLGPAGLCPGHPAGPPSTGYQKEEKCHPEVATPHLFCRAVLNFALWTWLAMTERQNDFTLNRFTSWYAFLKIVHGMIGFCNQTNLI